MTLTLTDTGSVVLQVRGYPTFLDTPNHHGVSRDPWSRSVPLSHGKLNAGL